MGSLMSGAIVDLSLDIDLVVFLYDITLWMFNAMSSFHISEDFILDIIRYQTPLVPSF
jgi:hypothetical protein